MTSAGKLHPSDRGAPQDDLAELEPPFPAGIVEEMLRFLVKAVRAQQLYLQNNPMYQRALDLSVAAFVPVWEYADEITFAVSETELRWYGHPVLSEPDKASDSLPWLLYKDGIREIQLLKGFEQKELVTLLEIIQRVRRASPDEDDLITILWEQDLAYLRYKYVELAIEGITGIEKAHFEQRRIDTAQVVADAAAPGIVSMSDFDSTLYFLDASEIGYLEAEISKEYSSNLQTNIAAMLLDIFEMQPDAHVREEVLNLLDHFLVHVLSAHGYSSVSYLLQESNESLTRGRNLTSRQRSRLESLPDVLSDRQALTQMLQSLDDMTDLPPQSDLEELFSRLRGSALEIVLGFLSRCHNAHIKPLIESAAERLAAGHTAELIRLINCDEKSVRLEAMRRAGALRSPAAVAPLMRAVSDPDPQIRLTAVNALSGIGTAGALQALEKSVDDAEREVRVVAVRALSMQMYKPALGKVEGMIRGKQIRDADLTEKMAFFEAYGSLAGEPGVQYLDGVLNGKGIFGRREDAEVRACAAMALGRIGSERALSVLQRAAGDKDVVVRSAINKALRGGTA